MEVAIGGCRLRLVLGDITQEATDAIVNAANSGLMGGGGVDGAIHRAGGEAIMEECRRIVARQGRLPTGRAVMTTGGRLRAKYVIHAVGPVWRGGGENESELLASAYHESLRLADECGLTSVAFPSISTGAFGYPIAEAAGVALKTVISFLKQGPASLDEVVFVLFGPLALDAYEKAFREVLTV